MTNDSKKNSMEVKVYSLTGLEMEVFSEVDPSTLTHNGTSVSFSTLDETIRITNAIVITRKPKSFF